MKCKETGESKTIFFLGCGHGHFDLKAYEDFIEGKLQPYEYPREEVEKSLKKLKELYPWIDQLPY